MKLSVPDDVNVFDRDLKIITVRNITEKGIARYLKKVPGRRYDFLQSAAETGIAITPYLAFRMSPEDTANVQKAVDGRETHGGRVLTRKKLEEQLRPTPGKVYYRATIIRGASRTFQTSLSETRQAYLLENEIGTQVVIDAQYLKIVRYRWPGATVAFADDETQICFFTDDCMTNCVGVAMPLKSHQPIVIL